MAYQPVDVLEVWYERHRVGFVAESGIPGVYAFEYEPSWRRQGVELAPLIMPTGEGAIFQFPQLRESEEAFKGLPPMLADALPDRFGNALIDAKLAEEGRSREEISPLDRLAYIGQRGMGALHFAPALGIRQPEPTAILLGDLVSASREVLRGRLDSEDGRAETIEQLFAVGTSAGGARAKAIIAWEPSTGEIRAGNMQVPEGFEQWLIKFDGVDEDGRLGSGKTFGRVEYAYSEMARAAGITMAETHLLEEHGRAHFMTKRFDRTPGGGRVHMQSLCALMALDYNQPRSHAYEQYIQAVDALGVDGDARQEAFRRMVFNVLARNNDDHTKNFSFLMSPEGRWSLSPAYDVTFSFKDSDGSWVKHHQMSVNGKFDDITRQDLMTFADKCQVPDARSIVRQVEEAVQAWPDFAEAAAVSTARTQEIADRMAEVRL
ncbi:type II toxin-antitoxin system HipA family toxin [Nesterenkonia populi]